MWQSAYLKITQSGVKQILGLEIKDLKSNTTAANNCMLVEAKLRHKPKDIKSYTSQRTSINKVYIQILDYLVFKRYPDENNLNLKETNILDLVLYIFSPILEDIQKRTKHNHDIQVR